ncbi:MAG: helix-turn-helix domain-containing protein [Salinibacter sp.]
MTDQTEVAAGKRFARDMRRIREDRGVSLSSIQEQTQIAPSLLRSFEEGGLYENASFNRVYLRSFVRAYAAAVDVDRADALDGLESALQGDYQNALAVAYLQDAPAASIEAPGEGEPEEGEPEAPPGDEDAAEDSQAETKAQKAASEGARAEEEASPQQQEAASESPGSAPNASPSRPEGTDEKSQGHTGFPEDEQGPIDAPPQPASVSSSGETTWSRSTVPKGVQSVGVALLVLVVVGVGLWMAFGTGSPAPAPEAESPSNVTDTAAGGASDSVAATEADTSQPDPGSRSSPQQTLGDTLHLTLRADSVVSGIRLRQDDDLRRPYWIEQGEATTFRFTSRITVENGLDDITLFLEGRPVRPASDSAGRIVLDRERVAALLDTAQSTAPSWSTSPDTVAIGASPADTSAS